MKQTIVLRDEKNMPSSEKLHTLTENMHDQHSTIFRLLFRLAVLVKSTTTDLYLYPLVKTKTIISREGRSKTRAEAEVKTND